MECKPCGKTFTGEVCYNQHLQSEKHKRKALLSLAYPSQNPSNNPIPIDIQPKLMQCTVCSLTFDSLKDFQSHSLSPEHAKNVIEHAENGMFKTGGSGINCNTISSSSGESSGNANKPLDKSDTLLSDFDNQRMCSAAFQYSRCEVCNKLFSGPEPYKQHMNSEPHRKKVDLQKNHPLVDPNQSISSLFTCEPCKKVFSGQIPYMQHMTSDIHKKKLQHLEALERFNASKKPDVVGATDFNFQPATTNPYFCKICNVQCSGIAPYEQHLTGSSHLKNVAKAQYQKSYPAEPTISAQMEDSSSKPNSDVCDGQSGKISTSNQGQEFDYVLPELAEKLRVLSTDELQDCIKVFEPNDSIDFDQLESKKMQIDSIDDVPGDNQMETKAEHEVVDVPNNPLNETNTESKVFKMCEVCNVPLFSVTDAFGHFESIEHFNKKWRSD